MATNVVDRDIASTQRDQVLVLLEEVAQVNRQLNTENRALHEEMKKRDDENKKALKTLEQKLDATICSPNDKASPPALKQRRRAKRVRVPAQCRVSNILLI